MKNKNTYSLLVSSEEKGRSIFEGTLYALVILCTVFTGWQFASNSVVLPGVDHANRAQTEMVAQIPAEQPIAAATGSDATAL